MPQGSVYIKTSKGIFPYSVLQKAEQEGAKSQQIRPDQWAAVDGMVPPPFAPESFLVFYESNSTFNACCNQIASDVAGLGWKLVLQPEQKEDKKEYQKAMLFFNHPNAANESLRQVLVKVLIDWASIGYCGIEVVRNAAKEVAEIYHVPAHTLRVHENQDRYCQLRGQKKTWFKKFGSETDIRATDGKESGKLTFQTAANELIWYMDHDTRSDYYGVPKVLPAIGDVVGLIGIRDYNLNFFENYGVPAGVVTLEGKWAKDSEKVVASFLSREHKGSDNAHKTLVVKQPEGCKFVWTPLSTEVKEASFRLYRADLKENVMVCYSMPPERIGVRVVGQLGGNVAEEATKIYVQAVVEPLQEDFETILTQLIMVQGLGILKYRFKFNDVDLRDLTELVNRLGYEIEHGMLTPNEARQELGLKTDPEGDKMYIGSGLLEIGEKEQPTGV